MSKMIETALEAAIVKAQELIKRIRFDDEETRKIAFSKAIDSFLNEGKGEVAQSTYKNLKNEPGQQNFWDSLSRETGKSKTNLKDIYSISGEQILSHLPSGSIPGDTKKGKSLFIAALILFAYQNGLQREWVSSLNIAEAVKHAKLYEGGSFANDIGASNWFRKRGVRKGLKYRLSADGISEIKKYFKEEK